MGSPTIKDVARAANVSVATVSYVLNNGPRSVTAETRERVLRTMQELGYQPNASARRLRLNRTHIVGLAIAGLSGKPGFSDLYFLDINLGLSEAADEADHYLMLVGNGQKLQDPDFYRKLAGQRLIDGLIVLGSLFSAQVVEAWLAAHLPIVAIGRHKGGDELPTVRFAYEQDAYNATEALIQRGHTRIGLMTNSQVFGSEAERLRGYQNALAAHGIAFDPVLVRSATQIEVYPPRDVVREYVQNAKPSVILSTPYREVCEFLDEIDPENRIGILALDEERHFPRPGRVLGGMRLPKYQAGAAALQLLLKYIERQATQGENDLPREIVLPSAEFYMGRGNPDASSES